MYAKVNIIKVMAKQKRKRPRPTSSTNSGSWQPVSVSLAKHVSNDNDDDLEVTDEYKRNHYDDPKLCKKAEMDLEMNPGEDCGMFFGLEVLDASQYRVETSGSFKRLIVAGDEDNGKSYVEKSFDGKRKKPELSQESDASEDPKGAEPKKKKRKKKKKNEVVSGGEGSTKEALPQIEHARETITSDQLAQIQSSWSRSSGGAHLHEELMKSLYRLGFNSPTPIQAATLSASTLGRRNLVGAAPTGSGKTLAFLLPILDCILQNRDENINRDDQQNASVTPKYVQALIMTPTRELATQIYSECEKLVPNQCVTLVGGIALVKQKRLLQTKRPSIVIATPGRLWAMLSSGENAHLKDLSHIKFLVLDEADRMTQEHSFPQLVKILNLVNEANPNEDDDEEEDSDEESDDGSRMLGLPGIRGEAKLTMLTDDILKQIEAQKSSTKPERLDESEDESSHSFDDDIEGEISENVFVTPKRSVHRQTFIYSATLTLPFTSTKTNSKWMRKGNKLGLDGGIAEILEKANAMGETKVVDLSSTTSIAGANSIQEQSNGVRLPPGLSLEQIKCTQRHKDSHLYAYLMTTVQGASGPCLVFCNSIAAVRRVGTTFQTLGFNVRILHAHMQQRARFKAVESLKDPKKRVIVVCTDVAARGLDIPSVSTVVHYDVARAVDTFVHRSGRTARGMGEGAVGASLSLIAPAEDKAHSKIVGSLNVPFNKVLLDGRLLTSSQERVSLASKIYSAGEMEQKTNASNRWFTEMAKEADLDLDDDLMEDESNRSEKDQQQLAEAKRARAQLSRLLKEPMQTQKFGKFLSTNSAALQNELKQPAGKKA